MISSVYKNLHHLSNGNLASRQCHININTTSQKIYFEISVVRDEFDLRYLELTVILINFLLPGL